MRVDNLVDKCMLLKAKRLLPIFTLGCDGCADVHRLRDAAVASLAPI